MRDGEGLEDERRREDEKPRGGGGETESER